MSTATFQPPDFGYGVPEAPPLPTDTIRRDGTVVAPPADTAAPADDLSAKAFIATYFGDVFGGMLQEEALAAYQVFLRTDSIEQARYTFENSAGFKARFPGLEALRKIGRPISVGAILDLERQYVQIGRQFDLAPGFVNLELMHRWIATETAPTEVQRRLTAWQTYERETRDPVAEAEIRRQFAAIGLVPSEGDFLMGVLDPARSPALIEQRLAAGLASGAAARSGFGALSIEEGLGLADRGVGREQAEAGFGALADARELFTALPGSTEDAIGREEQLSAAFYDDAGARRRIERRGRSRAAEFGGGSGGGLGRSGLSGLGAG